MLPDSFGRRLRSLAGFTLIELLIVILIIGILVAIAVPAYLRYTASANDRDAQAALQTAYKAAIAGDSEVNSSRFPAAATVVADIQGDEPAASVVSGSCVGSVGQAPVKQVIIDTASTSSQLTLCTRSASGAIWKLAGPLTGTPTVSDGSSVTLTATGFALTDALRASGQTGEAFSSPSSYGIYQPITNLLWNGGAEMNMLHIGGVTGTGSVSRDATVHKYGSASVALVSDGTNTGNGAIFNGGAGPGSSFFAVTAGTTYTGQGWGMPNGPDQFDAELWWFDSSGNPLSGTPNTSGATVPASAGTWTFASVTAAAPAGAAWAQLKLRFSHSDGTTKVVSGQIAGWVDGAQVTQSYVVLPYVDTTNGSATEPGGRLQFPSAVINPTQGWMAFRVYFPWAAAANPDNDQSMFLKFFHWGDDGTHELQLYFSEQFHKFGMSRKNGTFTDGTCPTAFTAGTTHTVIGVWTASQVGVSVDGAPICWTPNNTIPSIAATTFDVGRNALSSGNWLDADILWMAAGTGAMNDTDAATVNGFGDTDKPRSAFPDQPTITWSADTATASVK